jgi:hypothetical protein
MKALLRLSPIFALVLTLAACGDDETELPEFATLFPADNEIGSYVEDPDGEFNDQDGPRFLTDGDEITDLINGAAGHFIAAGFVNFGVEAYTDSTHDIGLFIWQMKSPDAATTAMDAAATGTEESLGDAARFEVTTMTWIVRKGVYVLELTNRARAGGSGTDDTAKSQGATFAAAILAEIP